MALIPPGWDGLFTHKEQSSWIPAPGFLEKVPFLSPSWKTAKLYKLTPWVHSSTPTVPTQTQLLHNCTPGTLSTLQSHQPWWPRADIKLPINQHLPLTHKNGTSASFILQDSGSLLPNATGHCLQFPIQAYPIMQYFLLSSPHWKSLQGSNKKFC